MIHEALADRANAPGRTGGTLAPESLKAWEQKLGVVGRLLGLDTPLADVDYPKVGAMLEQRKAEGVEQHTRHKELQALRFGLRLMRQGGAYPHDVDYVTRKGRFAKGYKPRERRLPWEEIPKLLLALMMRHSNHVSPERLALVRERRAAGVMVKDIAAELGVSVPAVCRYLQMNPKPTAGALKRARHAAWLIATAARRKESFLARAEDHDLARWTVHLRGTKTGKAARTVPIAPPFRPLLVFAIGDQKEGLLFGRWQNIGRGLRLAAKRAGLAHVSPNDLRRTHASLVHQGGIPLEDIAPIMGHSGTRMLELVYAQPDIRAVAKSIGRLEAPSTDLVPDPSTILSQPRGDQ
jgi:integrase